MPIIRDYVCPQCNYFMHVTLTFEQWDTPPPACPACEVLTRQEFTPPSIVGSHRAKATAIAEEIADSDYNVADMKVEGYEGVRNKVRYKDQLASHIPTGWVNPAGLLQQAVVNGRQHRKEHGSALDLIKQEPDLIANSKRISSRIW